MNSNYNILTLPMAADGKYKVGDTYKVPDKPAWNNWRHHKFEGLIIKNIDYHFGVRLHFDWNEWDRNEPKLPTRNINENITYNFKK